jgi:hypothetical protein
MKQVIIYGGTFGSLVLAKELSINKDFNVVIINPSKSWGGYFGGIDINGNNFDIGMNLFEFTSFFNNEDDVFKYDSFVKSNSGKFSKIIKNYVKEMIVTRIVDTPEVYFNDNFFPDYYISNSLEILSSLDIVIRDELIKELKNLVSKTKPLHASNKNIDSDLFYRESYLTASLINHGSTFHSIFIEPFIRKILNISSCSFPAILHRIPWAPLYYPETLLNSLEGNFSETIVSEFEYPENQNFSFLSNRLFDEICSIGNIKAYNDKVIEVNCTDNVIRLESGSSLIYDELIMGVDVMENYRIFGNDDSVLEFEKANFSFLFIRLPKKDIKKVFSVLFILDSKIPFYRITNQSNLKNNTNESFVDLIVEFNSDYFEEITGGNLDLRNLTGSILLQMGLIFAFNPDIFEFKKFKNAINLPTFSNIELFNKIKSRIYSKSNVNFIGNTNNLFANSFNDNLIQALLISKKINYDN